MAIAAAARSAGPAGPPGSESGKRSGGSAGPRVAPARAPADSRGAAGARRRPRCLLLLAGDGAALLGAAESWSRAGLEVLVARDGNEAVNALQGKPCDLFVADVDAPGVVELLVVARSEPRSQSLPFLLLAPHGTTSLEKRVLSRAGVAIVARTDSPAADVRRALEAGTRDVSPERRDALPLSSLCELLAILRKTCTVDVSCREQVGSLSIVAGRLVGALTGKEEGIEAARSMLGWRDTSVEIRDRCPMGLRQLDSDLHELVVQTLGRSASIEHELFDSPSPGGTRRGNLEAEGIMVALETYLDEFKGVKGYIAGGLMDFTGEMLAVHTVNPSVQLDAVGAVFNDIFRGAHEASKKIGLEACSTLVMTTPKGIVVMECSGPAKNPHLHAIAVLEEGGNQALAKLTMSKILPLAVKDLG